MAYHQLTKAEREARDSRIVKLWNEDTDHELNIRTLAKRFRMGVASVSRVINKALQAGATARMPVAGKDSLNFKGALIPGLVFTYDPGRGLGQSKRSMDEKKHT